MIKVSMIAGLTKHSHVLLAHVKKQIQDPPLLIFLTRVLHEDHYYHVHRENHQDAHQASVSAFV